MKNKFYEIWLLGDDKDGNATDYEQYVGDFENKDISRIVCGNNIFEESVQNTYLKNVPAKVCSVRMVVEECVNDNDGTTCIDVVCEKVIWSRII